MSEPQWDNWWLPIQTRDDLPNGWVFLDVGDGILEPVLAFEPDDA